MKKCKLLHIHDGKRNEICNGDFLLVEEYPRAAEIIEEHIHDGWEVKQIINQIDPGMLEEGNFSFYKSGILVYLEKQFD